MPQRDDIGYQKIVVWLGRDDLVPRRLEFFGDGERAGEADRAARPPRRRCRSRSPRSIEVETPAKGSKTVIASSDAAFDLGLEDDLFTQRALERGER